MSRAKVIVFIVEGYSDKESLEAILSQLYEEKNIVFSIVGGDITTDNNTQINNIQRKLVDKIKESMGRDKFLKSDIEKVVHLVDMDGAYIPNDKIVSRDIAHPNYTDTHIETNNVDGIISRNAKKSLILNKLSTLDKVFTNIDYQIYFMSCNLEHVLHNIRNADDNKKTKMAQEIEDKYYDNPEQFVEFMKNSPFTVAGSYPETWEFIKKDLNSLNRYSNFHLFLV